MTASETVRMSPVRVDSADLALEGRSIAKHFDGIYALRNASLSVRRGEIHALLGENGAGKSTLVKILTGATAPDSGEVFIDGSLEHFKTTREATARGIVALYQEHSIIPGLSVAENISLGDRMPSRAGFVNRRAQTATARRLLDRLGQGATNPAAIASRLSPVTQTMIAIARALAANAQVIFLDEPTAALTDREIADLFSVLRSLRDSGVSIVYVSHRLEEVFELCDRATILRNGAIVHESSIAETSIDEVISRMAGRDREHLFPPRVARRNDESVKFVGLTGSRVRNLSLTVGRGEILAIGGLAGSGRSELLRLMGGAQRLHAGHIEIDGIPVKARSTAAALNSGIALVPEERRSQGLVLGQSIGDNIAMASLGRIGRFGFIDRAGSSRLVSESVDRFRIKIASPRQPVGQLSGGNQQKVLLAKFLARKPRLLLLDEPTRGIDVGTKAEIYLIIRALAEQGMSIVMVSSEVPELLGLADRIAVMHEGHLNGIFDAATATDELLLSYFYGRYTDDNHV